MASGAQFAQRVAGWIKGRRGSIRCFRRGLGIVPRAFRHGKQPLRLLLCCLQHLEQERLPLTGSLLTLQRGLELRGEQLALPVQRGTFLAQ